MSYYVLQNTLNGLGANVTPMHGRCPSLKEAKLNSFVQDLYECCREHGLNPGTPVHVVLGDGGIADCQRQRAGRVTFPRTRPGRPGLLGIGNGPMESWRRELVLRENPLKGRGGMNPNLLGLGNGVLCADVPWTNQMGTTGSDELCPSGATCGQVIALQQALTDLGFPCDVTGMWEPSTATALNNWRAANGYPKNFNVSGTAQDCTLITQQWTALKATAAPAPAADDTSTAKPGLSRVGAKMVASPALMARLRAMKLAASKTTPTSTSTTTTEGGAAVVETEKHGWWASQSQTTHYAIIGGAALLVAGGVYLAVK